MRLWDKHSFNVFFIQWALPTWLELINFRPFHVRWCHIFGNLLCNIFSLFNMQERKTCVHKRKYIESARAGGAKKGGISSRKWISDTCPSKERREEDGFWKLRNYMSLLYRVCFAQGGKENCRSSQNQMRHLRKQLFFFHFFSTGNRRARVVVCWRNAFWSLRGR